MTDLGEDFLFSQLEDLGEEGLLEFIVKELRSGKMSPAAQMQLAMFFQPKGRKKFRLKLTRKRGISKNEARASEFLDKIEPFRIFRDHIIDDLKDEIARKGEENTIIKQAELPKKDGGFGVSRTTAKKLMNVLKAEADINRQFYEDERASKNARQIDSQPKPK